MNIAERVYADLMTRVGEAHPRPRIAPVRRLAELAGSPQLSYPVLLVAGTNGKTSTSRAIESLLRAHGLRTGLFTSPHLVAFTERFQVDGEPVEEQLLAAAWDELQLPLQVVDAELEAQDLGRITFFEALAVLAYTIFADAPVEVAVIEVGMGGEWDATNIVDARVAVFTPIDIDHAEILGTEIATIARTKAGIVKPGTAAVVTSAQHDDALTEISAAAEAHAAQLFRAADEFSLTQDLLAVGGRQVEITGTGGQTYPPAFVPLFGRHQAENIAVAVAAVEAFFDADRPIPDEVYLEGLAQVTSPGRLQLIGADPIVYVDAAHNPHGAAALARAISESFSFSEITLVAGALAEKDAAGIFHVLAPIANAVTLAPVDSPRTVSPKQLLPIAQAAMPHATITVASSLPDAIDLARAWATQGEQRAVLVAGSVLLAGEAISYARREGWGTA